MRSRVILVASPETLLRTKNTFREQDRLDRAFLEGVIADRQAGR